MPSLGKSLFIEVFCSSHARMRLHCPKQWMDWSKHFTYAVADGGPQLPTSAGQTALSVKESRTDWSVLTEMHGKNAKGEAQYIAAPKDQTYVPIGRLCVNWCYLRVALTGRDFARLSLLPWFEWINMVQCAKCSGCQYAKSLLLLADAH